MVECIVGHAPTIVAHY